MSLIDTCCAICRNNFTDRCIECEANEETDKPCEISKGLCSHKFHAHCIKRWLKLRDKCPLDDQPWEEDFGAPMDLFEDAKQ